MAAYDEELSGLTSNISNLSEEIKSLIEEIKRSKNSIDSSSVSVSSLNQQLNSYKSQIEAAKVQQQALKSQTDSLKSKQSVAQENIAKYSDLLQKQINAMMGFGVQEKFLRMAEENLANAMNDEFNTMSQIKNAQDELLEIEKELANAEKDRASAEKLLADRINKANLGAVEFNRVSRSADSLKNKLNMFADATTPNKWLMFGEVLMQSGDALMKLRDTIYGLQAKLGTTFDTAISAGAGALTNVITSYFTEGPQLSVEDTVNAINAYQKEFGTILTTGAAAEFAKNAVKFGVDMSTYAKAQRAFLSSGSQAANTQQKFIGQFRDAGLTAAQALQFAAQNADLVAIAGNKYADALARAAANSTKIGVNLDKTEQFADNLVSDFEGGIAKFGELGAMGFDFDVNKLMEVAATGGPGATAEELSRQLAGNQEMLKNLQTNRFARIQLQQATGLGISEIERLAGVATTPTAKTQEEQVEDGTFAALVKWSGPFVKTLGALISLKIATSALKSSNIFNVIKEKASGIGGLFGGGGAAPIPPVGGGGEGLSSVAKGASSFGANMIKAGVAMVLIAGSIFILAKALQQFRTVNWPDMGKAAVSLGVLAAAAFGLSFIAPAIGIGALAIGALGLSLIPFGAAIRLMAPGLPILSGFISTLAQLKPGQVGVLFLLGRALASMGVGLAALGAAALVAAPGLAVLGGLQKLGILPTGLLTAGTPVEKTAEAGKATTAAGGAATSRMDTSRLEAKLDQVVTAIKGMKIQMNGHDVGTVTLNSRSPLFTASPARVAG